jgi:hypothetical protein
MEGAVRRTALMLALACGGVACSDEDDGECFDYSRWDGSSPQVSARNDLLNDGGGLLRRACGASSCHGSETRPDGQLYLGPPVTAAITETQFQSVLANLIDFASKTNPSVRRVVRSDPENSFLMRKLDGCFEGISDGCTPLPGNETNNPCGDRMPQTGPLDAAERNEIRSFITQGAPE